MALFRLGLPIIPHIFQSKILKNLFEKEVEQHCVWTIDTLLSGVATVK